MATVGNLLIKIGTNTKDLEKGLSRGVNSVEKASKKMEGLGATADKTAKALGDVGEHGRKGLSWIETAASNAKGSFLGFLAGFSAAGLVMGILNKIKDVILAIGKAIADMAKDYSQAMRNIQAKTGATGKELKALGDTSVKVFKGRNWGESITDAADAVIQVNQVLGETGDTLEDSATKALIMRDVFGMDIPQTLRAVRSATVSFGIESAQVFDMMTATIQRAGDPAGDLADTVNEYSIVFAKAGFSAEEMFGILEAGVRNGARNFDVVADAVKEFTIRIIDGSELTESALNDLFTAVGQGSEEFNTLRSDLEQVKAALENNEAALRSSEGAYKAQKSVVDDLQRQLSEARRELDELARPNLAGMEEFDDKLFELEQQAKRAQLALLGLEPESDAFEETQKVLDEINKQIDRTTIERDLIFDEQLRNIEKAATEGLEPVTTYAEALDAIAQKRSEIAQLEDALTVETGVLQPLEDNFNTLTQENEQLKATLTELESQLEGIKSPAAEMLEGLANGSITGRDAMSQVIQMLKQVDDQVVQNQIGVALFGTKWEDLGPNVILALDPATAVLRDFEGATEAAGEAASTGIGNTFETIKRQLLSTLVEMPEFQAAMERMERGLGVVSRMVTENFGPAMAKINDAFSRIIQALTGTNKEFSVFDAIVSVIVGGLGTFVLSVQLVAEAFDAVASGVEWVVEKMAAFDEAINKVGEEGLGWLDDKIPDWLKPGSPPPLAYAIQDISKAIKGMPSLGDALGFNGQFAAPLPAVAGAGAAAGGGSSNVTVNIDGVSVSSEGGSDPDETALIMALQLLRQALKNRRR